MNQPQSRILTAGLALALAIPAFSQTYSLDRTSQTVDFFFAGAHTADDLLQPGATTIGEDAGGAGPFVAMPGSFLRGAMAPMDIDAISSNHGTIWLGPTQAFKVVFSVRPGDDDAGWCVGVQHAAHQQPADLYLSSGCFHPLPPCGPHGDDGAIGNDCYIGQRQLDLVPTIDEGAFFGGADPGGLDNLDGFDFKSFDTDNDNKLDIGIYFSVTEDSITSYSGFIFYLPPLTPAPRIPTTFPPVYATRIDLGMNSSLDDIDGLVVFDADNNALWSVGDAVLLSLKEGSPALTAVGSPYRFAGDGSPADVFMVYRHGGGICVTRIAEREDLGFLLGDYADIDALEILRSNMANGDANCDGTVNPFDIQAFLTALEDIDEYHLDFPHCCGEANVDTNDDGTLNPFDIQSFLDLLE